MNTFQRAAIGLLASLSLAATASAATTFARYRITDLGDLHGVASSASGINNAGQVVGNLAAPDPARPGGYLAQPALWDPADGMLPRVIETCAGGGSALAINVLGVIAGRCGVAATAWIPEGTGVLRTQILPNGLSSAVANGINANGVAVGSAIYDGFLAARGGAQPDLLGGPVAMKWLPADNYASYVQLNTQTSLYAVNGVGQFVGAVTSVDGSSYPQRWSADNAVQPLGGLPGGLGTGVPYAINDLGQAVGMSSVSPSSFHACRWDAAAAVLDLGVLSGETDSIAWAINAAGQVVGNSGLRAFVWIEKRGMRDLNELIAARDPLKGRFVLQRATGINDAGQIVGYGQIDGKQHGFLLTPVR